MNLLVLAAAATTKVVPSAAATLLPRGATPNVPAPVPAGPAPQTAIAAHAPWLTHTMAGLFIVSALALICLLAVQTTKQEGLTGTIGGRVESLLSRPARSRGATQANHWVSAVAFVVFGFVLSLTGI